MKVIATINPEKAPALAQLLGEKQVAFQTRTITDAAGFEVTGFTVSDEVYEDACNVVEEWCAAEVKEANRLASTCCPSCHSPNLEYESDDEIDRAKTIMSTIYRCKDCGRIFAKK